MMMTLVVKLDIIRYQFKQLIKEQIFWKNSCLNGIQIHDLCDTGADPYCGGHGFQSSLSLKFFRWFSYHLLKLISYNSTASIIIISLNLQFTDR